MTVSIYSYVFGPYAYAAVAAWTLPSPQQARAPCIAGAAASARRCTNRSRGTSRPTWGSPARGASMGTAWRTTWSERSAAIWNAAFWPTAWPVPGARSAECRHDFLIAFSCKGRGVCPACNARRMVETPAHLVDQVFAPLPLRQWVLSVPKRLRYFLQRDPEALGAVLHIYPVARHRGAAGSAQRLRAPARHGHVPRQAGRPRRPGQRAQPGIGEHGQPAAFRDGVGSARPGAHAVAPTGTRSGRAIAARTPGCGRTPWRSPERGPPARAAQRACGLARRRGRPRRC